MSEHQEPNHVEQPTTHHAAKPSKWALVSNPRIMAYGLVAVIALAGIGWYGIRPGAQNSKVETPAPTSQQTTKTEDNTAAPQDAATLSQQEANKPADSTPPKATSKPTTPSTTPPAQAPTANPAPNTTNCISPSSSQYAYYPSMTNSQYLQTNGYVDTKKFYAALQFAGLINTINSKQYVVLAMSDSQWDNFTQAQLNWMNASPANMKAVLGWQIITSCITWNGVNPVKNMAGGATRTVNSLNGPVTYTHSAQGPGKFGNGSIGIWDWFTSNGSVTIAGFVNTSSVPQ